MHKKARNQNSKSLCDRLLFPHPANFIMLIFMLGSHKKLW